MPKTGVLLIHGLTGSPHELGPIDIALQQSGYQTQLVTLPGHGDKPSKAFIETSAIDILDHCAEEYEALSRVVDQVYIVGHSLGGICTLLTAAVQPPKLKGIVVFSAPYEHAYFFNYIQGLMQLPVSDLMRGLYYDSRRYHFVRPDCKPWNIPRLLQQTNVMFSLMKEQVHNIDVPVSLVHSAYDLTIPYREMTKLAERIGKPQRVKMTTLTQCGHKIFPASRDIDEAVRVVQSFIETDCEQLAQEPLIQEVHLVPAIAS